MQNNDPTAVKGGGLVDFSYEDMVAEYANTPPPAAPRTSDDRAELDKFPILDTNRRITKPDKPSKLAFGMSGLPDLTAPIPAKNLPTKARSANRYLLQKQFDKRMAEKAAAELSLPEYAGYAGKVTTAVFFKAPHTRPDVNDAVLRHIFTVDGARGTQAAIRAKVQSEFPGESVSKGWTAPLSTWMLKKAILVARSNGAPFDTMAIKGKYTLSSLHKLAKAAVARSRGTRHTYKAAIAIGAEQVFINGQPFTISINVSKGTKYPTVRIPLATLRKVLDSPIS